MSEDENKEKRKRRFGFDDLIYNQRIFLCLIVFGIAVVSINPWVLYQTQQEDRASEQQQTREVIDNQQRNFNTTNAAIRNQDELINKLDSLLDLIIEGQHKENVSGNLSEARFNATLGEIRESVVVINKTVLEQAARQHNLTRVETLELVDVIRRNAEIIPIVNQSLTNLNATMVEQLIPVVATLDLQRQAELDHFNQTEVILNSIGITSNATQLQARQIQENETR